MSWPAIVPKQCIKASNEVEKLLKCWNKTLMCVKIIKLQVPRKVISAIIL